VLGAILISTILFVVLYKCRCMKLIFGWLIMSSTCLLGGLGAVLLYLILSSTNLGLDYISFSFISWNFAIVGVTSVFWHSHIKFQQGYLICISSLLAIFMTRLPEWTTFAILGVVAVYDLFSVLCPNGPLRVLVEEAQARNESIPALVYSAAVFTMMAEPATLPRRPVADGSSSSDDDDDDDDDGADDGGDSDGGDLIVDTTVDDEAARAARRERRRARKARRERHQRRVQQHRNAASAGGSDGNGRGNAGEEDDDSSSSSRRPRRAEEGRGGRPGDPEAEPDSDEPVEEGKGIKLGLGDFIFYSVLIGRAAMFDMSTVFTCFIAVITGLFLTLLLLAIFRKALPALPISIALGLLFYFVTRVVLLPFVIQAASVQLLV
jgi:presenilin 1